VPFDYRAATATSASAITSVATVTSITLSYSDVDPARPHTKANLRDRSRNGCEDKPDGGQEQHNVFTHAWSLL
jgi:hypothetical protein